MHILGRTCLRPSIWFAAARPRRFSDPRIREKADSLLPPYPIEPFEAGSDYGRQRANHRIDRMIKKREWLVLGQGQQPQRQLSHLSSQRILVDPIQTPLRTMRRAYASRSSLSLGISCSLTTPADAAPSDTTPGTPKCRLSASSQASTNRSDKYRHACTRNAPDPHAMSQTLSSSSSFAVSELPFLLRLPLGRPKVNKRLERVLHIGSVRLRGV